MRAQIVSFHCVLKNNLGQVLGSSFNQDVINQSEKGCGNLEGLVAGLQNLRAGEKRLIQVPANRAYGLYDPDLVIELSRSELDLGDSLEVGKVCLRPAGPHGEIKVFRVICSRDSFVTLDGNHPLAGQDLIFDIEVISAREAIDEDFEDTHHEAVGRSVH